MRAALALLLAGCGPLLPGVDDPRPSQAEAVHMVWHDVYGRSDPAPAVRWVTDLTCLDPSSGRPGFRIVAGGCREGETVLPTEVSVAWRDGDTFSTTAMAHEFQHARAMRDGWPDPYHRGTAFQPGGDVDRANQALKVQGL